MTGREVLQVLRTFKLKKRRQTAEDREASRRERESTETDAFFSQLSSMVQVEQLIANLERRRNAIFIDLERHRFGLGEKLRAKAEAETIEMSSETLA
jgi:hypothetical protein